MKGSRSPVSEHFPGYDVVARAGSWDPVTASTVLSRLGPPGPLRFFTVDEEPVARALLDRLLALDAGPAVPVLELIDARLAAGQTDGWRYEDMPEDTDAWRCSLAGLDTASRAATGARFAEAPLAEQMALLEGIRTADRWQGLPAARVWSLWMRYACTAFYSHPWAWNEIGFGGPAYPTGYKALGVNGREPWEVPESDARDPEPWARRVERARARHAGDHGGGS